MHAVGSRGQVGPRNPKKQAIKAREKKILTWANSTLLETIESTMAGPNSTCSAQLPVLAAQSIQAVPELVQQALRRVILSSLCNGALKVLTLKYASQHSMYCNPQPIELDGCVHTCWVAYHPAHPETAQVHINPYLLLKELA